MGQSVWSGATLAVVLAGCAAPPPVEHGIAAAPAVELMPALPPEALATQSLFRVGYQGPEGEGTVRLTLRVATRDSFEVSASDRLGRAHWALIVEGAETLWIDHEATSYCPESPALTLPGWADGPMRLAALPVVLFGAVPVTGDAEPSRLRGRSGGWELRDEVGQRWTVTSGADGRPEAWTLWRQGEPAWWWRREEAGGRLSQRGEGRQLEWRQVVSEAWTGQPRREPPAGYRLDCESLGSPP